MAIKEYFAIVSQAIKAGENGINLIYSFINKKMLANIEGITINLKNIDIKLL